MALATRCPYCHTSFRVAHDQLKLRAGLVRCGSCKQIFNGVENLLGPDSRPEPASVPEQPPARQAPSSSQAMAGKPGTPVASPRAVEVPRPAASMPLAPNSHPNVETSTPASAAPVTNHAGRNDGLKLPEQEAPRQAPPFIRAPGTQTAVPHASAPSAASAAEADIDINPLTRMTLMDFTAFDEPESGKGAGRVEAAAASSTQTAISKRQSNSDEPDDLDRAIEDLQRKPWRGAKNVSSGPDEEADDSVSEPDFVQRALRQQRIANTFFWLLTIGSGLLAILLAAQIIYTFRNEIAIRIPAAAPALQQACAAIGCEIGLPAQINSISLEASELRAIAPHSDTLELSMLLRNRSSLVQAWPSIELTLNDANEQAIARRVFAPGDYLASPAHVQKGFAAESEQVVKLFLELPGLKASGFRVYLFHP